MLKAQLSTIIFNDFRTFNFWPRNFNFPLFLDQFFTEMWMLCPKSYYFCYEKRDKQKVFGHEFLEPRSWSCELQALLQRLFFSFFTNFQNFKCYHILLLTLTSNIYFYFSIPIVSGATALSRFSSARPPPLASPFSCLLPLHRVSTVMHVDWL